MCFVVICPSSQKFAFCQFREIYKRQCWHEARGKNICVLCPFTVLSCAGLMYADVGKFHSVHAIASNLNVTRMSVFYMR